MKINNNLEYQNISELEQELTTVLEKLEYLDTIDIDTFRGLESYRNELYSAREQYDKKRLMLG